MFSLLFLGFIKQLDTVFAVNSFNLNSFNFKRQYIVFEIKLVSLTSTRREPVKSVLYLKLKKRKVFENVKRGALWVF